MFKLVVYVPELSLEEVKSALFSAGSGRLGNYDCCSWQVLGEGQFRPLEGSNPHVGTKNEIEVVSEWRLEVLVQGDVLPEVISAMKNAHPYEEPAFEVYQCVEV